MVSWLLDLLERLLQGWLARTGRQGSPEALEQAVGSEGHVYVEADGAARELSQDEADLLDTPFHPCDGARPWIKSSYDERGGDGRMNGFLKRARLPRGVTVRSSERVAAP